MDRIKKKSRKSKVVCRCPSYPFPHRSGGGKCKGSLATFCSLCNQPVEVCDLIELDMGIGPYEFWGYRGVHHDRAIVTSCCESPIKYAFEYI